MTARGMLGVCYYPEQWPQEMWRDDARQMAEIGIRYVRIAEFAWSRIEPSPGAFDWDWLDDAVAILGSAGLQVVMCTPTATPPKWLVDRHPDILPWDREGRPRRFGSRRHYDFSSPGWQQQTRRICTRIAERYGENPAVAGWQLDNEYGCHDTVLSYSPAAATAFRDWLRARYGTVDALNAAWGGAFWSQDYRRFEEVDPPNLTVTFPNPAHELDYRRFSSDAVVAYNRLQADIVRARSPGRFIAHNFMGFFTEFDHFAVARDLDVVAWDSYPLGFTDQRMGLPAEERARFARCGHPDVPAFNHDLYRGIAHAARGEAARWWVMEQQPGPVNWASHNPAPAEGMVRLWSWEAFAHGGETVSYFRWRQAAFAQEQMHAGLNRPDYTPDRASREAAQVARERPDLDLPAPDRGDAALVFDYEAAWVLQIQPQGRSMRYQDLVFAFYSALRRLGLDIDVVPAGHALDGYRLVVVPTLPIVTDAALAAFQAAAGAVVFGPRSGSKTQSFQHPSHLAPGPLQAMLPVKVVQVESLTDGLTDTLVWRNQAYPVTRWRETLESAHPAAGRYADNDGAAIVAASLAGGNKAHYLGFWPDDRFLDDYLGELCREQGFATRPLGESLRTRRLGDLRFLFNYGTAPVEAPAPDHAQFVLGDRHLPGPGMAAWKE
ncbi:MAG: beta-galactosidase [Alphaproteobacteria bacterium]